MRTTEAKFVRKYNVGQYESEEYSLTALVEEGDCAVEALTKLKADVATAYAGETPVKTEEVVAVEPKKKAPKKKKDVEPEPEEVEETEEEEIPEDVEEETEEEDADEEPVVKKATSKKKKPQTYSRSVEQHKELFSKTLHAVAPDWKKTDAMKAKAKIVSQKMEGKEFLDAEGNVLAEFKAEVKKLMLAKK